MTTRLERLKKGLVCLVPKDGKAGITCHEKTICDCTAKELIELLEEAEKIIRDVDFVFPGTERIPRFMDKLAKFQGGK